MSRTAAGLVLALCFLVGLVTTAPARLLTLLLPADQAVLQGFEGTLWRGSASRCLLRTEAGYLHLGALEWSLDPLSLALFAPRLRLHSTWGAQTLAGELVVRGSQDLDLQAFEARLSADLVRQFAPMALAGTLSVQLQSLLLRDGLPYSGAGRLVWQNAGWQSPQGPLPLGSYALDFQQPPGEQLVGEVLTLSGPVRAQGTLRLQGREYALDILVSSQGSPNPQLEQALSLIATPGPEGHRVKLDGEF